MRSFDVRTCSMKQTDLILAADSERRFISQSMKQVEKNIFAAGETSTCTINPGNTSTAHEPFEYSSSLLHVIYELEKFPTRLNSKTVSNHVISDNTVCPNLGTLANPAANTFKRCSKSKSSNKGIGRNPHVKHGIRGRHDSTSTGQTPKNPSHDS